MAKFKIGSPSLPRYLVDRKNEIKDLYSKMISKSINYNVAVIGYRRVGKTSILIKLQDMLSKKDDYVVVYFDVKKNMAEPKIFFTRLEKEIFDSYVQKLSKIRRVKTNSKNAVSQILGNIMGAIKTKKIASMGAAISSEGIITPQINFGDKAPDYAKVFYSVFKTAEAFADEANIKFIIILDEFQDFANLARYPGLKSIFDLFRSVVQERGDNVSYVVSGSRVHMLSTMLNSGKSSLFSHFEKMTVTEMEKKHAKELFTKYSNAKKIKPDIETVEKVYDLVGGVPFYVMALAEAWDGKDDISDTYDEVLTSPLGSLKNYVDYVLTEDLQSVKGGPVLRTILRALAIASDGLTYSELSHKIDVAMSKLPFYMESLEKSDLVKQEGKKFIIRDKIVKDYLRFESSELI